MDRMLTSPYGLNNPFLLWEAQHMSEGKGIQASHFQSYNAHGKALVPGRRVTRQSFVICTKKFVLYTETEDGDIYGFSKKAS